MWSGGGVWRASASLFKPSQAEAPSGGPDLNAKVLGVQHRGPRDSLLSPSPYSSEASYVKVNAMALFKRRRLPKRPRPPRTHELTMGGDFSDGPQVIELTGESAFQDALAPLSVPKREDGFDERVYVALIREPANQHDSTAIAAYAHDSELRGRLVRICQPGNAE